MDKYQVLAEAWQEERNAYRLMVIANEYEAQGDDDESSFWIMKSEVAAGIAQQLYLKAKRV